MPRTEPGTVCMQSICFTTQLWIMSISQALPVWTFDRTFPSLLSIWGQWSATTGAAFFAAPGPPSSPPHHPQFSSPDIAGLGLVDNKQVAMHLIDEFRGHPAQWHPQLVSRDKIVILPSMQGKARSRQTGTKETALCISSTQPASLLIPASFPTNKETCKTHCWLMEKHGLLHYTNFFNFSHSFHLHHPVITALYHSVHLQHVCS